jgi:hypothetical protein
LDDVGKLYWVQNDEGETKLAKYVGFNNDVNGVVPPGGEISVSAEL